MDNERDIYIKSFLEELFATEVDSFIVLAGVKGGCKMVDHGDYFKLYGMLTFTQKQKWMQASFKKEEAQK